MLEATELLSFSMIGIFEVCEVVKQILEVLVNNGETTMRRHQCYAMLDPSPPWNTTSFVDVTLRESRFQDTGLRRDLYKVFLN